MCVQIVWASAQSTLRWGLLAYCWPYGQGLRPPGTVSYQSMERDIPHAPPAALSLLGHLLPQPSLLVPFPSLQKKAGLNGVQVLNLGCRTHPYEVKLGALSS